MEEEITRTPGGSERGGDHARSAGKAIQEEITRATSEEASERAIACL
jgi:hypothetical protein